MFDKPCVNSVRRLFASGRVNLGDNDVHPRTKSPRMQAKPKRWRNRERMSLIYGQNNFTAQVQGFPTNNKGRLQNLPSDWIPRLPAFQQTRRTNCILRQCPAYSTHKKYTTLRQPLRRWLAPHELLHVAGDRSVCPLCISTNRSWVRRCSGRVRGAAVGARVHGQSSPVHALPGDGRSGPRSLPSAGRCGLGVPSLGVRIHTEMV